MFLIIGGCSNQINKKSQYNRNIRSEIYEKSIEFHHEVDKKLILRPTTIGDYAALLQRDTLNY